MGSHLSAACGESIPTVTAVNLPLMGIRSTLFIAMKKQVDGEPKIAASAAFAVDPILKHIWIVDDDIDVFDNDQVLWAYDPVPGATAT